MAVKKRRIMAIVACIILLAALLFSALFLVRVSKHQCAGDNCPICAAIENAEQTLRQSVHAVEAFPAAMILSVIAVFLCMASIPTRTSASPVSLKVRLDN